LSPVNELNLKKSNESKKKHKVANQRNASNVEESYSVTEEESE
jgi:hypothetical protein